MKKIRIVLIILLVFGFYLSSSIPAFSESLGDLSEKLIALEERIKELEGKEHSMPVGADHMAELKNQFGDNLGAFADINFRTDSREYGESTFTIGAIGLYTSGSYKDRLNFIFEMVIVAHNSKTSVSLERVWTGYTFNDALIVRAGRFHIALGHWNKTYHHGKLLYYTIERPFFLKFEETKGVIPVHIVGLELTGSAKVGAAKLKYWLEVGNGPGIKADRHSGSVFHKLTPTNMFDTNDSKQVAGRLCLDFKGVKLGIFGTKFYVDFFDDTLPAASPFSPPIVVDHQQFIYGADLYFKEKKLEVISEYFRFDNKDEDGEAYYTQLAYLAGKLTPFLRYERLRSHTVTQDKDMYLTLLSGGANRLQYIGGFKYDLDYLRSGLKVQYRFDKMDINGEPDYKKVLELQWAFHF
ncbi:MAG: hypothetical protein KAT46_02495 [Deltaproteobacteria bacterium]|nr:hypothetical protein [Deltaproteobacteria bacterium]